MSRRRRRPVRTAVTWLVVLGLATAAVVIALDRLGTPAVIAERCAAASNGTSWYLSPAQADNAALVGSVAVRRALPARAVTVGIATALQESKLINTDHGDRDSIGLFQQRPSQGWGTAAQLADPVYATNAFYDALVKIPGYEGLTITDAAQRVQRSGFPEAYAGHEAQARAWASALTGYSPASVTCELRPAATAGSVAAVTARIVRDYGALPTTTGTDGTLTVDAGALGSGSTTDDTRLGWSLAQWSAAVAAGLDLDAVATADQVWTRSAPRWAPSGKDPVPAGQVRLTLAAPR
jgi:hypothetical protein